MDDKSSFIVYQQWGDVISELSDEEAGQLFKALFLYSSAGAVPSDLTRTVRLVFLSIKAALDANAEKWAQVKTARAEAGRLGGRPRKDAEKQNETEKANGFSEKQNETEKANGFSEKQNETEKANGFSEKQTKAKKAVYVSVFDSVFDSVSVKNPPYIPPSGGSGAATQDSAPNFQSELPENSTGTPEVLDSDAEDQAERAQKSETAPAANVVQVGELWNSICAPPLSRIVGLSGKRGRTLRARLREHPAPEWWEQYFRRIASSAFLCGRGGADWRADFDWVINAGNMNKVLEGRYDDDGSDAGRGGDGPEAHRYDLEYWERPPE